MASSYQVPFPRAVFYDANGNPLAAGLVYTYILGTTTPKTTWQDNTQTTANTNPIVLDANGSCLLYGSGSYTLNVTDALGNNIPAYSGVTYTFSPTANFTNIAALRANLTSGGSFGAVYVEGYTSAADGGEGTFIYVASDTTSADNGGTIIVDAANQRWYRDTGGQKWSAVWFGAKGDNATDNTTILNNALTAMGNGTLYVPPGTYVVSNNITLPNGRFIEGAGPGVTNFAVNHATNDIFILFGGTSSLTIGSGLSSFSMTAKIARTGGRYILLEPNGLSIINDFALDGCFTGIETMAIGSFVSNGSIRDIVPTSGTGIKITGGNDQFYDNIVINGPTSGTQCFAGIAISNNGGSQFTSIDSIQAGYGIVINPGTGQSVKWCNFTDVYCDTCATNPFAMITTGTGIIYGTVLENCWASSGSGVGFLVNGAGGAIDGTYLTNARVVNNQQDGIVLQGSVFNWHQIGGMVSGNSQASMTYSGINVAATVSGSVFEGIRVGPAAGLGDTQLFGLILAASIDSLTIQGCDLTTAQTPIGFSSIGTNVIFRNNIGTCNANRGNGAVLNGTSSIVVAHQLTYTPNQPDIMITPTTNIKSVGGNTWWVSAVSSTNFTVSVDASLTSDWFFGWVAEVRGAGLIKA